MVVVVKTISNLVITTSTTSGANTAWAKNICEQIFPHPPSPRSIVWSAASEGKTPIPPLPHQEECPPSLGSSPRPPPISLHPPRLQSKPRPPSPMVSTHQRPLSKLRARAYLFLGCLSSLGHRTSINSQHGTPFFQLRGSTKIRRSVRSTIIFTQAFFLAIFVPPFM